MKLCFLLQRNFAYVGHEMAKLFREKYGVQNFCSYVYLRRSYDFLKSQKDINYSQLLLDDEIHKYFKNEQLDLDFIKNLEKEYGLPNLWPYINIDRIVRYNQMVREYPYDTPKYSHEEMMRILQVRAKAIIKFLDEEKPDAVIFTVIGGMGSLLLYHIAKKKNIKTYLINSVRIGVRQKISECFERPNFILDVYQKLQNNQIALPAARQLALEFLAEFRAHPKTHSPVESAKIKLTSPRKQLSFLLPNKLFQSVSWIIRMTVQYLLNKNKNDFETIKPWHHVIDKTKRKLRILFAYRNLYATPVAGEEYAFYPLHMNPEVSTMLYAPFYTDQLWVIKQIAKSLPVHFMLYVKEHPTMYGYRPRSFYKELKKMPNVKIINPSAKSFGLTQNAKLITTIAGTAGWEAVCFKKPVITFGDTHYNALPMVKRCRAIEDLPYLIKEQLENFVHDEAALVNFVTAAYKESVDSDLVAIWEGEAAVRVKERRQELLPLVGYMAEKLNLEPLPNNGPAA